LDLRGDLPQRAHGCWVKAKTAYVVRGSVGGLVSGRAVTTGAGDTRLLPGRAYLLACPCTSGASAVILPIYVAVGVMVQQEFVP